MNNSSGKGCMVAGKVLIILFPIVFLFVSFATQNFRYFFYALSASLAAVLTGLIIKKLKEREKGK
jgi:hypothetical protein